MLSVKIIRHSYLLSYSFKKATGKILIDSNSSSVDLAEALYTAPFVLFSHGTEKYPVFNYSNLPALKLWELDWKSFMRMPSRLSAEKASQAERHVMLEVAKNKGFISDYQGIRISNTGKRFVIKEAVLRNNRMKKKNTRGRQPLSPNGNFYNTPAICKFF